MCPKENQMENQLDLLKPEDKERSPTTRSDAAPNDPILTPAARPTMTPDSVAESKDEEEKKVNLNWLRLFALC
jgi:hypothetical protein